MSNMQTLELDANTYTLLTRAAEAEGKPLSEWIRDTASRILSDSNDTSVQSDQADANGWPPGFFETIYGSMADAPLERLPQPALETREEVQ